MSSRDPLLWRVVWNGLRHYPHNSTPESQLGLFFLSTRPALERTNLAYVRCGYEPTAGIWRKGTVCGLNGLRPLFGKPWGTF